jgi:hypothetical protein
MSVRTCVPFAVVAAVALAPSAQGTHALTGCTERQLRLGAVTQSLLAPGRSATEVGVPVR